MLQLNQIIDHPLQYKRQLERKGLYSPFDDEQKQKKWKGREGEGKASQHFSFIQILKSAISN